MDTAKLKALFLDRDGVVNQAVPLGQYITRWEEIQFQDGIEDLLERAVQRRYLPIVVTNQPQVAKGLLKIDDLIAIHHRMKNHFGNKIETFMLCPHVDEDNCKCRKPKPGLLERAGRAYDISFPQSLMVGDSWRDIQAGQAAGCQTVFLHNQYNKKELGLCKSDYTVTHLREIHDLLL